MSKKIKSKYDSLSVILGQMTMCNEFTDVRGRREKLISQEVFNGWIRGIGEILEVKLPKKFNRDK